MELSSSRQKSIQHQYDAFAKKTLAGEAKNYLIELAKQSSREVCFSELKENELNKFSTLDEYSSDYYNYTVAGYDVYLKDDLLNEALNILPVRKREIILLSYFLDMSDEEIGAMMNVVRSTVFRHRKNALAKMKKFMEEKKNDEHK